MGIKNAKSNSINRFIAIFSFITVNILTAQTFENSNLPIVIINTDLDPVTGLPLEIVDEPRVLASMKIIYHKDGSRNYLTDQNTTSLLNYNGRISIEIRGQSSQEAAKKQFGLTTLLADNISNNNVGLLGMPSENDWILNGFAFEPSYIRDYLCYNLSRNIGNYAPQTAYCEVIINGNYRGLYQLQEKIKVNSKRVNILKVGTTDNTLPNISGGYITKSDKLNTGETAAWVMKGYHGSSNFGHVFPKPENITVEQNNYIEGQFENLEEAAGYHDLNLKNGFPTIIDIPTFIDFMIINELSSNSDGYSKSTYYHKDRNGKLRAGPVWDHNLTFGNGFKFPNSSKTDVWQFDDNGNVGPKYWKDMFDTPTFKCYFAKRWNELTQTGQPLNYDKIVEVIDWAVNRISEATPREDQRWEKTTDHVQEITNLKNWLALRINWLTNNAGAYNDCSNVNLPPLVISKINYNPSSSTTANNEEFIEITNTGNENIDLSGIYFRELGLTYQFPYGSSIAANQKIMLASNTAGFASKYGFQPFGEFTRNLSNSSQKIVLADAFGNIIDTVEYFDSKPWPTQADGNGSYLELINTALDNNIASSWKASNNVLLSTNSFNIDNYISFYPNPTSSTLNISTATIISQIEIIDSFGKTLENIKPNLQTVTLDMTNYATGIYIAKISCHGGIKISKIIKQ